MIKNDKLKINVVYLTKQTSTSLSLTVTLSGVEGCLHLTFKEDRAKLNNI
jgi:hypothetical protein